MIVLSDGQPAPCGGDWRDLKLAVGYITKNGIVPIGIGIASGAVKQFYPTNTVVSEVAELPKAMLRMLKNSMKK